MAGSHAVGPAADSAATSSPPCALCAVIGQLVAPRAAAGNPRPRAATRPSRRPGEVGTDLPPIRSTAL